MINATTLGLVRLINQLSLYELLGRGEQIDFSEIDFKLADDVVDDIVGWLKVATDISESFHASTAMLRVKHFKGAVEKGITWREAGFEARALRDAFSDDLDDQLIYRYGGKEGSVYKNWKSDWAEIVEKFPSVEEDAKACADCYALGYGTASVFHAMRILEYGLAALARDVGREPGVENWQNIIDQVEAKVRELQKTLPRGIEKSERLKFLAEAAKEFSYFKDGWRNHVSHNRAAYDLHQARNTMEHVRNFMKILSSQLSETGLPD